MKLRSKRLHLDQLEDRIVPSSPGDIEWLRQFGSLSGGAPPDPARAVAVSGGNIYVAGDGPGQLPYVRKYDTSGNMLWTREFAGGSTVNRALGIAADASGVYVVGREVVPLPGNLGNIDAFVIKYDANGNQLWTRLFGTDAEDSAGGVAVNASGVYVVGTTAGYFADPHAVGTHGGDAFVRKIDTNGTEQWTRQFGSAGADSGLGVAVDDAGVYVAGYVEATIPGQTSAGGLDAFLGRFDSAGNELWTRQFGTPSGDAAFGVSVDGSGVYVAGYVGGASIGGVGGGGALPGQTSAGGNDSFVRKYDANGTELWTRQFGTASSFDGATSVVAAASGVYVGGYAGEPGQTGSVGWWDASVRKFDASGAEVWARQFGGLRSDGVLAVAGDAGGVYAVGYTESALPGGGGGIVGIMDSFVRRYDAGGTIAWTHQFGPRIPATDSARAVDADGNVYVAGTVGGHLPDQQGFGWDPNGSDSSAFVRKYDASGTELWTRQFSAGLFAFNGAFAIAVDASGVYVAGAVEEHVPGVFNAVGQEAFVRKFDSSGNDLWVRQFGTTGTESVDGIAADASCIYVTGSTTGTFPGQTSAGGQDAFVRKYDVSGNELWTRQFGSSAADQAVAVTVDASGVYVAGTAGGALSGQVTAGGQDAFVRQYDASGGIIWTRQFGTSATDSATDVAADDSGVYVSGFTTGTFAGQTSAGGQDAFLRRFDASGTEIWTRQFGTTDSDQANGVAAGATGIYVAGSVGGALPGKTSAGDQDAFVRKYDIDGAVILTGQFGTAAADSAAGVAVSASGLFVAGSTNGIFPGQTGDESQDVFVAKIVDGVIAQPTSTSLSSSASPSAFGQSVTVTATVGVIGGGSASPTGTVQFRVDGTDFGAPVLLVDGAASIGMAGLSAEPHTIAAVYSGDGFFAASTSDSLNQVVNQATTAAMASVSTSTPLAGVDSLTLSAVISVVAPGSGNPTGTVTFYDGSSVLGTVNLVDGAASLALGNTALTAGSHTIRAVYSGDENFQGSESTATVNVLATSTIQGLVYVDANNDGQVDFGETAIPGVTVTLTGLDDLGQTVHRVTQTDAQGIYLFANLRPSNAAGYSIAETQPGSYPDGLDTLGTVNGVLMGSNAINDVFSGMVIAQGGSLAENYNFGELPATGGGGVEAGQTATIGYWQNRNGQKLIRALNGGETATQLGHWLAVTFPNMYSALDGMTNAGVASFYKGLFARTVQTAPGGPPKVDAQVMATALAVYVTNQTLSGTTATAYGFQVSATGVGTRTFNVGNNGAAFGVANHSSLSVMDLLLAVNARSHNGVLYDQNGDGQISSSEASLRTMANDVFSGINEAGDI